MTINMLILPRLNITEMTESEDDYRFQVETTSPPPSHCPKCGTVPNLYQQGKKEQLFFDLPTHAKRVGIFESVSVISVVNITKHSLNTCRIWMKVARSLSD